MHSAPSTRAVLALLFNAFIWGVSWLPLQTLREYGVHPLWATSIVYGCAVAALLMLRPRALGDLFAHPNLLWLGAAAGLTNIGFNWAVAIGDVLRVALLFYLMPAWSVLVAWALLGERPTRGSLLRLALALAGVALVLREPGTPWPVPRSLADLLAVGAGACFALTNALLRRWRDTPSDGRALAMFGGGAIMSGAVAVVGHWGGWVSALPAPNAAWLLWAGVLCLAFLAGNLALQYGAARMTAQATALLMMSELLFATGSAVPLGAAQLTAQTLAGGSLIVLAALLAVRDSVRRQPPELPD